jgi:hypothetical protein
MTPDTKYVYVLMLHWWYDHTELIGIYESENLARDVAINLMEFPNVKWKDMAKFCDNTIIGRWNGDAKSLYIQKEQIQT